MRFQDEGEKETREGLVHRVRLWIPRSGIEKANLLVLGGIGAYVAASGALQLGTGGYFDAYWLLGFQHYPITFIVSGLGLIGLALRWKIAALPLFLIATNLVQDFWLWYSPSWNIIEGFFFACGWLMVMPRFKNPVWLLVVVAVNMININVGGGPVPSPYFYLIDFHRVAEAMCFVVFIFGVKGTRLDKLNLNLLEGLGQPREWFR